MIEIRPYIECPIQGKKPTETPLRILEKVLLFPLARVNTPGVVQEFSSFPLPPTSREDFWLIEYLEWLHDVHTLYFYKYPYPFSDSNPCLFGTDIIVTTPLSGINVK
ncbi:hypothetical protein TNCV_1054671 [Trichonephila clavipes]|nr:hypothetical protein TNCV_1054671 [Trichonephila clavipes]